jgi:hypothetical protein
MKRNALWFVILVLLIASWPATIAASPPHPNPAPTTDLGWLAEYYTNPGLHGGPALTRYEADLNNDWGYGSPNYSIPSDYFSARWTRSPYFYAGTFKFCVAVDDGVRVWVDGQLIIDAWIVQSLTTRCASQYLSAGNHTVQMAYFENNGQAVARLWWTSSSTPLPVPTATPAPPEPTKGPWAGQYFKNKSLSGNPALLRVDPNVSFDWGYGSPAPGLPVDCFSARWTRDVVLLEGNYTFFAKVDDGVRMWVDGNLVIDAWYDQGATTHDGSINLGNGSHHIIVEYYENTGMASIVVWWSAGYGSQPGPSCPGSCSQPGCVSQPGCGSQPGCDSQPGCGSPAEVIVDNDCPAFWWGGPLTLRHVAHTGYGNNSYWTYNSGINPVNYGKWIPQLPGAGHYEVWAYIPGACASSANVRYRILHNGMRDDQVIGQCRYNNQWVSLGTYYFNAMNTGNEFVLMYDNTREPDGSTTITFDAMKFVRR